MKSKIITLLTMILFNTTFGSKGTRLSWERPVTSAEAKTKAQKLQKEGFGDEYLYERILTESRVPESVVITPIIENASWNEQAETEALAPYQKRIADFKKAYAEQKTAQTDTPKQLTESDKQKLEAIRKKIAARTLVNAYRESFINPRFCEFSKDLEKLAAQNYPKFKKLICTNDYLTKTDWLYQFLEKIINKKIFQRNADGTLNPDRLEENINIDWVNNKIENLLEYFQSSVYETFILAAIDQINDHHMSWIDAVSIPAPEGSYGFTKQTPKYPIAFYEPSQNKRFLILGEIFNNIIASFLSKKIASSTLEEEIIYTILNPDNPNDSNTNEYRFSYQNEDIFYLDNKCDCESCKFCENKEKYSLLEKFEKALFLHFLDRVEEYIHSLGYNQEVSETFSSYKKPIEPKYPAPQISDTNKSYNKKYNEYLKEFNAFPGKLLEWQQAHINWRQAADEVFFLGHLVIDKNLEAFEALGGDKWLSEQPDWVQDLIIEIIDNIKHPEPKIRFKTKTTKQSKTQTTKKK